jgi:hypothetical protein
VNIVEEPYAGNPQVRFREGCASVQLQYRDMTDDASTRLFFRHIIIIRIIMI